MVFLSLYSDPVNTGIGFAISLTGIPAYYIFIYFNHRPKWLQRTLGNTSLTVTHRSFDSAANMKLVKHYLSIIYLMMELLCGVVVNSPKMEKIPSLVGKRHKFLGVLSSTVKICQIKHVHSSTESAPCEKY